MDWELVTSWDGGGKTVTEPNGAIGLVVSV